MMHGVNLTDAQKAQIKSIREANKPDKAKFEQLKTIREAHKNGTAITDLPSLGQAMAKDVDVARCAVNRVWNWAMSRGDIVNDLATIPPVVTNPLVKDFTSNGYKLKRTIRNVFTSDDFVKF